jgi:hypothetical protein
MNVTWGFMKFSADANKCYSEVKSLSEITPENIVAFARDENTELHKCFQWDDEIAAESWRKQQARMVVASLTVTVETKEYGAQSYRLIEHDNTDKAYKPVVFTVRNEDEYARLLSQAKAELASFKKRYKAIRELSEVIEEIDRVLSE